MFFYVSDTRDVPFCLRDVPFCLQAIRTVPFWLYFIFTFTVTIVGLVLSIHLPFLASYTCSATGLP